MNKPLLFTCEHGGYRIPPAYRVLFRGKQSVLESHRGWDRGALTLARQLVAVCDAAHVFSETSRLLIDLNRSLHHPHLFSEFTRYTDRETREQIIQQVYLPYRQQTVDMIDRLLKKRGAVYHFSIHSFTPVLDKIPRNADIGLLYDPRSSGELTLCKALQKKLQSRSAQWHVRRNYPYRGNADGFTTWLRKKYAGQNYFGVEIEVNQKYVHRKRDWRALCQLITDTLPELIRNAR